MVFTLVARFSVGCTCGNWIGDFMQKGGYTVVVEIDQNEVQLSTGPDKPGEFTEFRVKTDLGGDYLVKYKESQNTVIVIRPRGDYIELDSSLFNSLDYPSGPSKKLQDLYKFDCRKLFLAINTMLFEGGAFNN